MKRIMIPALIVLSLLFLLPRERSLARDDSGFNLAALKWKLLSASVVETDLGKGLPEVVILKLTNDQYAQNFPNEDTALKYLNDQKIFKRDLLKVKFCDVATNKGGGGWILIIPHTSFSTGSIVAWQLPKMDGESY